MSGSIEKVIIDGITYRCKADADLTENSEFETEGVPTSGETLFKTMKQVPTVEGVDLIVDSTEKQTLRDLIRTKQTVTLAYKEEDGTLNSGTGRIQNGGRTTLENTMSITLIPLGTWEVTAA